VWRDNEREFTKGFFTDRTVSRVIIDPEESFADVNRENNTWELPALREGEQLGG